MPYIGRDEDYEEPLASPTAMWTDLYELTMAHALFFEGIHEQEATFHAFVRSMPYKGAYLVTAGQNIIFEWLDKNWNFKDRDIRRLAKKTVIDPTTKNQVNLFKPEFLEMLKNSKMKLTIDAMPEGEMAFSSEPVYRVSGPLWQCLAVESAILNTMNSQSNFATYGSMLKNLAHGKPVIEFGLRRSQAVGGLSSSRGCYVGGLDASSNCWAETNYGINTVGTMAHAYVMVHDDEFSAFTQWAKHNPYLGIFLVDTYNTLDGVTRAIAACKQNNIILSGIRLDSGDLAYLAVQSRNLLDAGGFKDAKIMVSNGLNAEAIESLEHQKAPIDIYAVGTAAATVSDQPALGGVYKVGNIYEKGFNHADIITMKKAVKTGATQPQDIRSKARELLKLSEEAVKMSYPGELDLIRYLKEENGKLMFHGGTILSEWMEDSITNADPSDQFSGKLNRPIDSINRKSEKLRTFPVGTLAYRPMVKIFDEGKLVGNIETVHIARQRTLSRLQMLDTSHRRRLNPHEHVAGIEEGLLKRQKSMAEILSKTGSTVEANKKI